MAGPLTCNKTDVRLFSSTRSSPSLCSWPHILSSRPRAVPQTLFLFSWILTFLDLCNFYTITRLPPEGLRLPFSTISSSLQTSTRSTTRPSVSRPNLLGPSRPRPSSQDRPSPDDGPNNSQSTRPSQLAFQATSQLACISPTELSCEHLDHYNFQSTRLLKTHSDFLPLS